MIFPDLKFPNNSINKPFSYYFYNSILWKIFPNTHEDSSNKRHPNTVISIIFTIIRVASKYCIWKRRIVDSLSLSLLPPREN